MVAGAARSAWRPVPFRRGVHLLPSGEQVRRAGPHLGGQGGHGSQVIGQHDQQVGTGLVDLGMSGL